MYYMFEHKTYHFFVHHVSQRYCLSPLRKVISSDQDEPVTL
jgi:hypothetical protein